MSIAVVSKDRVRYPGLCDRCPVIDQAGGVTEVMGWGFQQLLVYRKPKR